MSEARSECARTKESERCESGIYAKPVGGVVRRGQVQVAVRGEKRVQENQVQVQREPNDKRQRASGGVREPGACVISSPARQKTASGDAKRVV